MVAHGKCATAVLILGGVAVALSGCEQGGGTTTPAPTSPAPIANTTKTTTTTLQPELGGCSAQSGGCVAGAQGCFGLYAGQCLDFWKCGSLSVLQCQKKGPPASEGCGGIPSLEISTYSSSFYNIRYNTPGPTADVLTVPNTYYKDINDLKKTCTHPELLVARMLEDGRRVFSGQNNGGAADGQCFHLAGHAGVLWMHLHTFLGSVSKEGLPEGPPKAVCANAHDDSMQVAKKLLGMTNDFRSGAVGSPIERSPPSHII